MANLGRKGDVYVARFRYQGKEYKKSLKTTSLVDARAAMHGVEQAIHRLVTGMALIPQGVDPGDFILSGGTLKQAPSRRANVPSITALVDDYLAHQAHIAPSYLYTQTVHLRNFRKKLGKRADSPCDRVTHRGLEQYLQARLKEQTPDTVGKERFTLVKLFEWAVVHGILDASPAAGLPSIRGDADKRPFRTVAEIEAILTRGGHRRLTSRARRAPAGTVSGESIARSNHCRCVSTSSGPVPPQKSPRCSSRNSLQE